MTEVVENQPRYWAVIPAAGIGSRMAADKPKQYLQINGISILDHTLSRFLSHDAIAGVYVALADNDSCWPDSQYANDPRVHRVSGGAERCLSVLNALDALNVAGSADDMVLVHDAARPCITHDDINRLIADVSTSEHGGLLALPMTDTVKLSDADLRVVETVDRSILWRAMTPQLFRMAVLRQALQQAVAADRLVTDEASAMEMAGFKPMLVEGRADNIKITHPDDLALAQFYLSRQKAG
ncbi:MAG: 2-C-methyl-D-erythritol 4-phosphate cytidylyltransferase [Chromatiales bacterium]|jgi:2-C-methyl-D-erythritol 4-phosphate cytidylyltransferase